MARTFYQNMSALHYRLRGLYNSLMLVQEYGVWDKLLFGTDYPITTVDASVDGLRGLNGMLKGTALPRLDTDQIESLIYRARLEILGVASRYPDRCVQPGGGSLTDGTLGRSRQGRLSVPGQLCGIRSERPEWACPHQRRDRSRRRLP